MAEIILTWAYALISVILVSLISLIGSFALMIKGKKLSKILFFLVSFSAGALLGDAFIHLLPESLESASALTVGIAALSGIMIFFVLEKFIHWRHCHVPTSKNHPHPYAMMNIVGDVVHNFIDGLIIGGSFLVNVQVGIATTVAVILHEIPQEIGDMGVLLHGGFSKKKAIFLNFLTATTAIVGTVIALVVGARYENFLAFLLPLAAGGFIYIAGSDLIPEMHKESRPSKSLLQLAGILIGIAVMASLLFLEI
ncbi:MAG: ZIP family metal transporter [Nanoarchaeota archaeon]|nr:ZIP family metal transporter [Nanoarchaeota archaeon]